jgi:hypothetical protein
MKLVIEKVKFADGSYINYSALGIETVCGELAHKVMFKIEKLYREIEQKPSKAYFECIMIEKFIDKKIGVAP